MLTRRRLLEGSIAGLLASASGGCNDMGSGRRVVVVGAGLSGLNAALILERWGFEVDVVEAKTRVGGRLWTLDHLPGSPEGGGNVMGAQYGRVVHMAHHLDIALRTPPRTLPSDYCIGDQRISRDSWASAAANPLPEAWRSIPPQRLMGKLNETNPLLKTRAWHDPDLMASDQSAEVGLRALGFPNAAIELINANNSYGNNLSDTSLMALYRIMGEFGRLSGPALAVQEATLGNMRLPEAMAKQLSRPVSLGEPVVAIRHSPSRVQVALASGKTLEADAAILALPLPALDYHKVVQLHCVVEAPFWEAAGWSGSWWTDGLLGRIFTRPIPDTTRYNMTVWINGDHCDPLNALDEAACTETITQALWQLVPEARDVTQAGTAHGAIRAPTGRLFFAGEHTAEAYRGMEGAMESGERAALEIMRVLA